MQDTSPRPPMMVVLNWTARVKPWGWRASAVPRTIRGCGQQELHAMYTERDFMASTPGDRRAQRLRGSVRLVRGPDDGAFDRAFWSEVPPAERVELVWDMVLESAALRGTLDGEPRLQRSVCRLERRGG